MKTKLALTLISALALAGLALAQPPGGGGPGGQGGPEQEKRRAAMSAMRYVDQSWVALCFEIELSNEQIAKLKPTFVWAYKARNAALKDAREKQDMSSAANTLAYVKKTLEERIPIVLTAAQKAAWQKWQTEQKNRRVIRVGMPGGAGPKGPGGPRPQ
jgi:hypothetical protein